MCHNFGGTHLADIFPTRAEMCHKNSRTSPAERRPKSTTDPECVTNVSRMCQECVTKKLSPKVRFGKSQFAFGAGGFGQQACPAKGQRGSFPIILDEEVAQGVSLDDQAFLVQAKEPQESVIRCFLGLKVGKGRGSAGGSAKLFRVASWRCWQALDHALFTVIVFVKPL